MELQDEKESVGSTGLKITEITDHPWNALTTVTTFDKGNSSRSTLRINSINKKQNSEQVTRVTSNGILVQSLIKQLCSLLEEDETYRNNLYLAICDKLHELKLIDNSYKIIELERLREQCQNALLHLLTLARFMTGTESSLCIPNFLMTEFSRYHKEFCEISFIAKGGFGEVYKALHRLDGIEYAIKKIVVSIKHVKTIEQHLDEVKTLAKLNHANIVSYKAAWIEPMLVPPFASSIQSSDHESYGPHISETGFMDQTESSNLQSIQDSSSNGYDFNKDNDEDILLKKTSVIETRTVNERYKNVTQECKEEVSSDIVSFRNSIGNGNLNQITEDNAKHTDCIFFYENSTSRQELYTFSNKKKQYMILYIQMTLCEQTLEQWMRGRINATPEPMIKAILQQILCGVDYIHSKKIVHHDIKPGNIFISMSGQLQIQLGDFGLACPLQKEGHRSVMGTRMYAAPEQLQGKCDPKSDIYSIGIILTELLIPTNTQMELLSIINCLKHGNIPEALAIERHKWAQMIIQLVQEDPVKRPWTSQLLQDLNENEMTNLRNSVMTLQNDNNDKDNKINILQNRLALLEEEVKKLKSSQQDTK